MFVIANLFNALAVILHYVLTFYMYLIIARAILSWVNPDPYNPIVRFLYSVTEPVLQLVRSRLPLFSRVSWERVSMRSVGISWTALFSSR